ncbi:helix-hairpin-helix domain-containing protein [uncultured Bacteroides sp.]|uniref:ComEA family DNA-binding protein n=1 Tax=uncultured Bacteroides sp. TaxID=162156 RepID=UPI0025F44494|nr:helix-hairpin-helix domain-containing protein [uncultured Bacteroides sp.]
MWKDFFYYTKTERQGIIVLVVLILGVYTSPWLIEFFSHPQEVDTTEQEEFEQDYNKFVSSLREIKPQNRNYSKGSSLVYHSREINLSIFDPNTADSATFLSLGLPPWMAKNILRYRSKQGKFRRPEDFRKIYGLTEEQYQTLQPYIRIAESFQPKDTVQLLTVQTQGIKKDTLFKYQPGTVISLNEADTTELKKIPGIGSGIARKIVNYRRKLGGFYQIEQLQEINLKVELLRPWFSIDAKQIHLINLNKASVERMMNHPYIDFYQAKAIVEYRKRKGNLKSLKQLSLYEEFTSADFDRIAPYVCFDL